MRVWRVSNYTDLSGQGGLLAAGRWNLLGTPVVFCSDHPSTALLEMLVRVKSPAVPKSFRLLTIEAPDDSPTFEISSANLPKNWRADLEATRQLGSELLNRAEHLLIFVPCVIVPDARNILLNPSHRDLERCSIAATVDAEFDPRLVF